MFQRNLHLQKLFLSLFLLAVIIPDLGLLAVIVPAQCVFAVVVLEQFELAVTIPDLFVLAVSAPAQCVFAVVVLELIHVQSLFQTRFSNFRNDISRKMACRDGKSSVVSSNISLSAGANLLQEEPMEHVTMSLALISFN